MTIEEKLKALYEEKDALSKDIEVKANRLIEIKQHIKQAEKHIEKLKEVFNDYTQAPEQQHT